MNDKNNKKLKRLLSTLICNHFCFLLLASAVTSAFTIEPPRSTKDFKHLSSLLVETFDSPSVDNTFEQIQWTLYERKMSEENTFRRYTNTAGKMRGKKYGVYLAKEFSEIVGMVELGMTTNDSPSLQPKATIGVLCVRSGYQGRGIGKALVEKCEQVVGEIWGEDSLCLEVEPDNTKALTFFKRCGFLSGYDDAGVLEMRNATICRRQRTEERPHLVLRKKLAVEDEEKKEAWSLLSGLWNEMIQ